MCVQRSLKLAQTAANTDTNAALLYKTGNYKEALVQEEKALSIAKAAGEDTSVYEAFILKIKAKL